MSFRRFMTELRLLGIEIKEHQIRYLVRSNRIDPKRDLNGNFLWSEQEIERIAAILSEPCDDRRCGIKRKELCAVA